MNMLTKYQCEICGAIYDTKEEAMKCELTHVQIEGIHPAVVPKYSHAAMYPSWLSVLMKDGKTIKYTRSE